MERRKQPFEGNAMQKESLVNLYCAAAAAQVELKLYFAAANGYGCAVECSILDGACSQETACVVRGSQDCELQKWMQEELL